MDFLNAVRVTILRARGGQHYWQQLSAAVEKMTPLEREALYRVLQNVQDDAEHEVQRRVRSAMLTPWRRP